MYHLYFVHYFLHIHCLHISDWLSPLYDDLTTIAYYTLTVTWLSPLYDDLATIAYYILTVTKSTL